MAAFNVIMHGYKSYIAYLLLVLLVRVLAPDALVLALHEHEHTEHAAISELTASDLTVGKAHVHCEVDDLFNSSFLAPDFSLDLASAPQLGHYVQPYGFVWKFTYPNNTYLRGPPVA